MDTVTAEVKVKRHPVIELFGPVIQGEGSQAGVQTLFIRFGGCDYRCAKCDSLHAVIPGAVQKNAEWLTPLEIADRCTAIRDTTGVEWITFSGGNPLMHRLDELVSILTTRDFQINVETQGTLWQDWLYAVTIVTVSPKSLGMGEKFEEGKYRRFLERLNGTRPLCVKVVVFSQQDLEFALFIQQITHEMACNWLYGGPEAIAYYLSLGNPYPPTLDEETLALIANPDLTGELNGLAPINLTDSLLTDYRLLSEEILVDPRLKAFRFLPQLHVLVYGNETGR
jgi:7-carboxy-7-deazaguanine synthase